MVVLAAPGACTAQAGHTDTTTATTAEERSLDPTLALETFDAAWTRIAETWWDPDMTGLDWDGVRDELRPRAEAAESPSELREVIRSLLSRMGESHFVLLPRAAGAVLEGQEPGSAEAGGGAGDSDPGLQLRLDDTDLLVTRVRPGSAADEAGIRPGWILTHVDDAPLPELLDELRGPLGEADPALLALHASTAAMARLRGPEGDAVVLRLLDGGDHEAEVRLRRSEPEGQEVRFGHLGPLRVSVSDSIVQVPAGTDGEGPLEVGVIGLSAWFPLVAAPVARAMDRFRELDGLVLDLRGNPGGVAALAMGIGGHLLDDGEALGEMRTRDGTLRFVTNPQRVSPDGLRVSPYGGPVAILVDGLSASTSEIFAGGLQGLGRARVFGEPTAGQALPAVITTLPSGDRIMHAVADYRGPGGIRFEGRGVEPDVLVPWSRPELLAGRDPALDAALQWLATRPSPDLTSTGDLP